MFWVYRLHDYAKRINNRRFPNQGMGTGRSVNCDATR